MGHRLNQPAFLEVLKKMYSPAQNNTVYKGNVPKWIDYTMSDFAGQIGSGLMAVFPKATQLACNLHHMTKGLQNAGGLRKKLKEDMK